MFADELMELEFQEQEDAGRKEAERKALENEQLLTVRCMYASHVIIT